MLFRSTIGSLLIGVAAIAAAFATAPLVASAGTPATPVARHGRGSSFGYITAGEFPGRDFRYALIQRGSMTTASVSNRGEWKHVTDLQSEVNSSGQEVMWFAFDDRPYVIRDRALFNRARHFRR